jgi:hypothetical protein
MRIHLAIPAYGGKVEFGHMAQLLRLKEVCDRSGAKLNLLSVNSCFLDLARTLLLHDAVHGRAEVGLQPADYLLTCDADTYHMDADDIGRMMNAAHELHATVMAAPVRLRGREAHNVEAEPGKYLERERWEGKILEVQRVGTAFMLIDCRWMREHWPVGPWFSSRWMTPEEKAAQGFDPARPFKMSEDFEFCDEVRKFGGSVWVDGRFEPVHAGITTETMRYPGPELI